MAAAESVVGAAGDQRRPKGHPAAGAQGHRHQPHQVEQHGKLLIGPFGAVVGLHGNQPAQLLMAGQQGGQKIRGGFGIGIEKHQQLGPAGGHAVVQRPGLAAPALGQGWRLDQVHGELGTGLGGDRGGAVAGVVVDHDHLQGPKALSLQGAQQVGQGALLIAGRNQHRHRGVAPHHSRSQGGHPQAERPAQPPAQQQRKVQQAQGYQSHGLRAASTPRPAVRGRGDRAAPGDGSRPAASVGPPPAAQRACREPPPDRYRNKNCSTRSPPGWRGRH